MHSYVFVFILILLIFLLHSEEQIHVHAFLFIHHRQKLVYTSPILNKWMLSKPLPPSIQTFSTQKSTLYARKGTNKASYPELISLTTVKSSPINHFLSTMTENMKKWRHYMQFPSLIKVFSISLPMFFMLFHKQTSFAMTTLTSSASTTTILNKSKALQDLSLWTLLFVVSAIMHSVESAITKISPYKVKEYIDEEGSKSPFMILQKYSLTYLLVTILIITTACSIYSTALFVSACSQLFPTISLEIITAALTFIILFFGEMIPKAIAVSYAEIVVRNTLPILGTCVHILSPLLALLSYLSDRVIQQSIGKTNIKSSTHEEISEDMLRIMIEEAEKVKSINQIESKMIKNVLNMENTEVERIMKPRIQIHAINEAVTLQEAIESFRNSKYSRIPVFKQDIDHIIGIMYSKDLLDHLDPKNYLQNTTQSMIKSSSFSPLETSLAAIQGVIRPAYFIPETMTCYQALQEMKARHIHMAIVVDEYGGTSGMITFEDILEEVVGEIYDEEDIRDVEQQVKQQQQKQYQPSQSSNNEKKRNNIDFTKLTSNKITTTNAQRSIDTNTTMINKTNMYSSHSLRALTNQYSILRIPTSDYSYGYLIQGYAELDDVCEALQLMDIKHEEIEGYSTIGGLLCGELGMIPQENDRIIWKNHSFLIQSVENQRKILDIFVNPVLLNDEIDEIEYGEEESSEIASEFISNTSNKPKIDQTIMAFHDGQWITLNKNI